MASLRHMMTDPTRFLCGVELVTTRGTLAEARAARTREMAAHLTRCDRVDWISITDNAGGNPKLSAPALGKPLLHAGKEVVIHLSCKDLNRNGLESQSWQLASEGFHNILALTGDYPAGGFAGGARPVFDIDSVGLLTMLAEMNNGLDIRNAATPRSLLATSFFAGAVVNTFKRHENELLPQLLKLQKKIDAGARFVIAQIGFNPRKSHELRAWLDHHDCPDVPLIGNVFLLNQRVAAVFHAGKIPGVTLSDELLHRCERHASAPDRGQSFFIEFAAKQVAVFRGLGYRGAYIGGVDDLRQVEQILETADTFRRDDWRSFLHDVSFPSPDEFYLYARNPETHLADASRFSPEYIASCQSKARPRSVTLGYRLSDSLHHLAFTPGTTLFKIGRKIYGASNQQPRGPLPLRVLEHATKSLLFDCQDCGDCSLPHTAFRCPESACAKNQRNGPCGGTRDGLCEVRDVACIWATAYDRLKFHHNERNLLAHAPVLQDQSLRHTSSWRNFFLGKDHNVAPWPVATTRAPKESPCIPSPSVSSAS